MENQIVANRLQNDICSRSAGFLRVAPAPAEESDRPTAQAA
jgi:hypothetical protein